MTEKEQIQKQLDVLSRLIKEKLDDKKPLQFNLGSGGDRRDEYINIDLDLTCPADVFLDINFVIDLVVEKKIPQLDRILAFDVLEHFPHHKTQEILSSWYKALADGGILEVRVPDLEGIAKEMLDGKLPIDTAQWLIYGGQKSAYDFHHVGFTQGLLEGRLIGVGFKKIIQVVKKDHNIILLVKK